LLSGRLRIEKMAAVTPKWGAKRETWGGIEIKEKKKAEKDGKESIVGKGLDKAVEFGKGKGKEQLSKEGIDLDWSKYLPSENLIKDFDVKKIVNPENMDSLKRINEIRDYADGRDKFWKDRLEKVRKDFESLQSLKNIVPKKFEPAKIPEYQKKVKDAENKINGVRKEFEKLKKEFQRDLDQIDKGLKVIDDLRKTDLKKLASLLGIRDLSAEGLSEQLLGKAYKDRLEQAYETFKKYKKKLKEFQDRQKAQEEEKKKRLKGETVHYQIRNPRPGFYLKKALLKVDADKRTGNWFSGELSEISSDQKLTGSPATMEIRAGVKSLPGADFSVSGLVDLRKEPSVYNVDMVAGKITTAMITNAIGSEAPVTLSGGTINTDFRLNVTGDDIKSRFEINLKNIKVQTRDEKLGKVDPAVKRILGKTLSKIDFIKVVGKGEGKAKNVKVSVTSNIDDIFKKIFKDALGEALKEIEKRVAEELDKQLAKLVPELKGILTDDAGKLKNLDDILKNAQGRVEDEGKKRLEKEIEKYKKQVDKELKKQEEKLRKEIKKKEDKAKKEIKKQEKKANEQAEKEKKKLMKDLKKKLKLPF
ncbi:MAG: hypothetical protein V3S46_03065, partial [Nitrospinota bacterium]